jgi:hypothetical protein
MTIRFKCDRCGERFSAEDHEIGAQVMCLCGKAITVPNSSDGFFSRSPDMTSGQEARFERINATLRKERRVPIYSGPLWTYDEAGVVLREPREVARRVFVLWAVSLRGEGISREELWSEFLDRQLVWPWASPNEKLFLDDVALDLDEAQNLVWRIESMWVLLWALGKLPDLLWPDSMCDTRHLMDLVLPARDDPAFVEHARLRPKSELLDAQELTMRLHWTIRDAWLNQRLIPSNLNWKTPSEMIVPVPTIVGRLIEERHYALNWLVGFGNQEWDDVQTPT